MNRELYIDKNRVLVQQILSAISTEDSKEYIVYQKLSENYDFLIMPSSKFMHTFQKYEKSLNKIVEPQEEPLIENNQPVPYADLLLFLEAETVREKLEVLESIKSRITEHIINSIEASLDLPAGTEDIESRVNAVRKTLLTHEKYEGRRLR